MSEVSVVIPTTESSNEDIDALRGLRSCSFSDFELVVRRDDNPSLARNEGVRRASCDKIVFLDDDAIPREGFLRSASEALDDHAAVTGRVIQPADAPVADEDLPWYDQGDAPKQTDIIAGCNMAIRRELFEQVDGFNEALPFGHEETELAERIVEETPIHYEPGMVVEHYFAESHQDRLRKAFRHGRADVQLWRLKQTPMRIQLLQTVPIVLPRPQLTPLDVVVSFTRRLGRIYGMLFLPVMNE